MEEWAKKMICVRLMGGLGNQMFQYAAGRTLSMRHNTVLKLDRSYLQNNGESETPRKFMLNTMNISAEYSLPYETPHLDENMSFIQHLKELYFKHKKKCCSNVLLDFDHRINMLYYSAPDDTYLVGYWQSEKYFSTITDIIKKEFTPSSKPDNVNKEFFDCMSRTNSVSLHVRRGDYVSNLNTNEIHGICTEEYYNECAYKITKLIDKPEFFVFSDDPEWVQAHLNLTRPFTIINHNPVEMPVWDMWLMSSCKHNIIANSSFSWWGAWLNNNPEKIVCAPKQWFADKSPAADIVPERWQRL